MKEKVLNLVGSRLNKLDLWIDDVYVDKENENTYVHIVLDSKKIIPLNKVVMATRIINPLLDDVDLVEGSYILDIYAKEKGGNIDE
ncbi:MAG: hypothetical protein PUD59_01905 [bacterium]|nr:hypothetical protein [bacterium]